jgi:hypothetical protein
LFGILITDKGIVFLLIKKPKGINDAPTYAKASVGNAGHRGEMHGLMFERAIEGRI